MSLFNETLLWFMKRRMPRIEAMYERPLDLQYDGLAQLIEAGRDTEWGRKYGYADFSSYATFRERVPISTYEEMFPYI
jgi:succinate-acetate transporter protein